MKYLQTMILIISALCVVPVTDGATIRIPQDYSSIQGGINAASNGDLVLVSPGTFYETIDFIGKNIEIRAEYGPSATVIDGHNSGCVVRFHNGETEATAIKNFTIRFGLGTESPDHPGGGITCRSSSPTISGNVIWSNSATTGGGIYLNDSDATISHCVLVNNQGLNAGGALYMEHCPNAMIFNCLVSENHANLGGAFYIENCGSRILSSTIDNSVTYNGNAGIFCQGSNTTLIRDCNITNTINGSGIYAETALASPSVHYTNVWHNALGEYGGFAAEGMSCISLNPLYIAGPGGQHYLSHIASGQGNDSPCVNAGSDNAATLGLDQRTTRTDQSADHGIVDIGFHYDIVVNPTPTPSPSPTSEPDTPTPTPTYQPRILRVPSDFAFIQQAINAAQNGDIVLVSSGIYYEQINFIGKDILVKADSHSGETILDGSGLGSVVTFSGNETRSAKLQNFVIRNGFGQAGAPMKGGGITIINGSSPIIEDCILQNCISPKGGGILIRDYLSNPLIQYCHFIGNTAQGDGGAIYIGDGAEPMIFNNLISSNNANYGGAIFATYSHPLIKNNSILENNAAEYGGGLYFIYATGVIQNNIIIQQENGECLYVFDIGDRPELFSNDIWGDPALWFGGVAEPGTGDIHVDPYFCKGPNGDFYLSQLSAGQDIQSQCVDAGMETSDEAGLSGLTTRTDHIPDYSMADLGFHYGYHPMNTPTPSPTPTPTCLRDTRLMMNQNVFDNGDAFHLQLRMFNTCGEITIDQFILLEVAGHFWCGPGWCALPDIDFWEELFMPNRTELLEILRFTWPDVDTPYYGARFWSAAFETGSWDEDHLIGEITSMEFGWSGE